MLLAETRPFITARSSPSPSVLHEILEVEVLLAVWKRASIKEIEPALQFFLSAQQPVRVDITSSELARCGQHLGEKFLDVSPEIQAACEALAEDFKDLAGKFSTISGRQHLRLRFERVEDDGCALFHVDSLPMRMLCTYAGPGTQWLEEDNVRRDQLGSRGRNLNDANAAIIVDDRKIHTESAWHVLIFKGRLWESYGYSEGLVHRSAPVRHPRDFRLRLTIDFSDTCAC